MTADQGAIALGAVAAVLVAIAAAIGPDTQCGPDTFDAYTAASERVGVALIGAAVALIGSGALLVSGAVGGLRRNWRRIAGSVGAVVAGCAVGLWGVAAILSLGCLG